MGDIRAVLKALVFFVFGRSCLFASFCINISRVMSEFSVVFAETSITCTSSFMVLKVLVVLFRWVHEFYIHEALATVKICPNFDVCFCVFVKTSAEQNTISFHWFSNVQHPTTLDWNAPRANSYLMHLFHYWPWSRGEIAFGSSHLSFDK